VSAKEYLSGRKRRPSKGQDGTRAALYLRVSTADQKPDLQFDGLRAYAARAGLDIIQDYCDVGVSGRREGRPQLNALMAAARNREIDCVLVWKFDRFARSTRHLLTALEEFNHLGVRFVSVQDQIDTDSPMGRAMFTIIGAMAELESSLISERVTAGMRAAQTRGKHLGRPPIPQRVIAEIETLATSTDLSIRQIQGKIAGRASRGLVGEITKHAPDQPSADSLVTTFYTYHQFTRPCPNATTHAEIFRETSNTNRFRLAGYSRVLAEPRWPPEPITSNVLLLFGTAMPLPPGIANVW
jgi:DNA invertase Pin-like site-specific DNA recombinase